MHVGSCKWKEPVGGGNRRGEDREGLARGAKSRSQISSLKHDQDRVDC